MSVSSRQLFTKIHQQLQQIYPSEEARNIAFLLLEHCFDISRTAVLASKDIPDTNTDQINPLIERLLKHEPVQYVLGETLFYGRWFEVNSNVLIPRPETEELVYRIVEDFSFRKKDPLAILDIGTGSGCIAVTLAAEFPVAQVWAIDVSEKALQVAQANARLNSVQVNFVQADILDQQRIGLPENLQLDLMVSNPPYVTRAEMELMRQNVTAYEPHLALFVEGEDALLFYRHIASLGKSVLKTGGACYMETNENYTKQVQDLFEEYGYTATQLITDMFGKDRFVKAIL
ncbi:peptide chain release factor N(5)-glutamine methyltransferase [Rhodocytophaga rosea]|uniref:Release factor glutamine methyltransferase n=1 Tax=Rhodocytophaga rosea TaxID=2704465 RepID=A0A6C0GRG5_9BACT|nr:peptide chain release factor N(5)-glutamine methyltransferase [Rhodocytophaga rosea]QHT70464.1 peptide chain release factor N(5)-glutamine methyltransferase [Rhodocytophaga rosea]